MATKSPTHLRRVVLATEAPGALAEFYERTWGLRQVAVVDETVYLGCAGADHHILVLRPGSTAHLVGMSLAMPDRRSVEAAARAITSVGLPLVSEPAPLDEPGGGYGLTVLDPDGHAIELVAEVAPAEPVARTVMPIRKISHLVLNTANFDVYAELLGVIGFELADEMPHMSFFRCGTDHHSLALAHGPHPSLNHIAFELPTARDVLEAVQRLNGAGMATLWGPGRHGPGRNAFGYFRAPDGQVVEYTAELEQVDVDNPPAPRMWLPEDMELYDHWAEPSSLRPTPEAREAMLGQPDPDAPAGVRPRS